MVRRIAAAAAVAAVAGFIAAGPAVADSGANSAGQAETHVEAETQDFVNVGGHNGVTVANEAEAEAHFGAWFNNH
ncbi:hypothetical protein ACFV9W_26365 [Streptomyces sp. NPDC059897]|uniref:hypothetical protein n=1 Tax=Streptomyces sp. NPDC059897 TaxID=3346994 RepID=UPI003659AFEB